LINNQFKKESIVNLRAQFIFLSILNKSSVSILYANATFIYRQKRL